MSCRTRSPKNSGGLAPYKGAAFAHFDYLKTELDKTDPSYRQ